MNALPTAPFTASLPRIQGADALPQAVDQLRIPHEAVIFDMDGVVTDTAAVHATAWKTLFDAILADDRLEPAEAGTTVDRRPFDADADYRHYVDGRRREDGIRSLLAARGACLPEGDETPGAWTVQGQAVLKNTYFQDALQVQGVRVFEKTVALIERLRAAGVPVGLVTASRNSVPVLAAAGLQDSFDIIVDGHFAAEHGLPGKPAPDTLDRKSVV